MLKSKKFVKKTKRGAVLTVTAEHYLRRDIWCSHERCAVCKVGQLTRLLARRLAQAHNHAGVASATCARSRGLSSVKSSPACCKHCLGRDLPMAIQLVCMPSRRAIDMPFPIGRHRPPCVVRKAVARHDVICMWRAFIDTWSSQLL